MLSEEIANSNEATTTTTTNNTTNTTNTSTEPVTATVNDATTTTTVSADKVQSNSPLSTNDDSSVKASSDSNQTNVAGKDDKSYRKYSKNKPMRPNNTYNPSGNTYNRYSNNYMPPHPHYLSDLELATRPWSNPSLTTNHPYINPYLSQYNQYGAYANYAAPPPAAAAPYMPPLIPGPLDYAAQIWQNTPNTENNTESTTSNNRRPYNNNNYARPAQNFENPTNGGFSYHNNRQHNSNNNGAPRTTEYKGKRRSENGDKPSGGPRRFGFNRRNETNAENPTPAPIVPQEVPNMSSHQNFPAIGETPVLLPSSSSSSSSASPSSSASSTTDSNNNNTKLESTENPPEIIAPKPAATTTTNNNNNNTTSQLSQSVDLSVKSKWADIVKIGQTQSGEQIITYEDEETSKKTAAAVAAATVQSTDQNNNQNGADNKNVDLGGKSRGGKANWHNGQIGFRSDLMNGSESASGNGGFSSTRPTKSYPKKSYGNNGGYGGYANNFPLEVPNYDMYHNPQYSAGFQHYMSNFLASDLSSLNMIENGYYPSPADYNYLFSQSGAAPAHPNPMHKGMNNSNNSNNNKKYQPNMNKKYNNPNTTNNAATLNGYYPKTPINYLKNSELIDAKYNPKEFQYNGEAEQGKESKFFIIKSYSKEDVVHSIRHGVWCSTESGNAKLNQAFADKQKAQHMSVYLFFSVNGSGQFCGMAEMVSGVDFDSKCEIWTQDKWKGKFELKWIYVKDIPNGKFKHITLPNNENKPVTNSRDSQEILFDQAVEVLHVFKTYSHQTTILDDVDLAQIEVVEKETHKECAAAASYRPKYSVNVKRVVLPGGKNGGGESQQHLNQECTVTVEEQSSSSQAVVAAASE